jgi:hypothetical protein
MERLLEIFIAHALRTIHQGQIIRFCIHRSLALRAIPILNSLGSSCFNVIVEFRMVMILAIAMLTGETLNVSNRAVSSLSIGMSETVFNKMSGTRSCRICNSRIALSNRGPLRICIGFQLADSCMICLHLCLAFVSEEMMSLGADGVLFHLEVVVMENERRVEVMISAINVTQFGDHSIVGRQVGFDICVPCDLSMLQRIPMSISVGTGQRTIVYVAI